MAISAYASFAYSQTATRMSQSLAAFLSDDKSINSATGSKGKTSIGQDLVSFSPMNQMRQTLSAFKETTSYTELNLSVNISTKNPVGSSEGTSEIMKGLDSVLKMISKDDEEYESIKGQLNSLLSQREAINQAFSGASSNGTSVPKGSEEGDTDISKTSSKEERKLLFYKMLLKMSKNSKEDVFNVKTSNESQSLTQAFFKSLSSIFSSISFDCRVSEQSVKLENNGAQFNSRTESSSLRIEEAEIAVSDPLVLDLSGEGIKLTKAGEGARFDITADGTQKDVAWVRENTAFLAYDKNGNGIIDNGSEFFGDQNGASDGFKELAKYDDNNDGIIDNTDRIFSALKLYRDLNGNGVIDSDELNSLDELGIKQLNLNCVNVNQTVNGNSVILSGSFERTDGTTGQLADVLLGYKKV